MRRPRLCASAAKAATSAGEYTVPKSVGHVTDTTDGCEYEENWTYQQYFETPEQFEEYCEAIGRPSMIKGQKKRGGIRSPKPVGLPMV